jgi:hypothetical protein
LTNSKNLPEKNALAYCNRHKAEIVLDEWSISVCPILRVGSGYPIKLSEDKHSSLFCHNVSDDEKSVIALLTVCKEERKI